MHGANDDLSELLKKVGEQTEQLQGVQQRLAELAVTETAQDKSLKVTVGGGGEVTDISFLNKSHQSMAPSKLGTLLVETISNAQTKMRAKVLEEVPEFPIDGVSSEDILDGDVRLDELFNLDELVRNVSQTLFGSDGNARA